MHNMRFQSAYEVISEYIQHCSCNDLDCSQTGRDCMFCKFCWLSHVQRYKNCDSNIVMRGCSAPAQNNMHFIFSINHSISSDFAAVYSGNMHSSNRKIFHERSLVTQNSPLLNQGVRIFNMSNEFGGTDWMNNLQAAPSTNQVSHTLLLSLACSPCNMIQQCGWLVFNTVVDYSVTSTRAWTRAWTRAMLEHDQEHEHWTRAWTRA